MPGGAATGHVASIPRPGATEPAPESLSGDEAHHADRAGAGHRLQLRRALPRRDARTEPPAPPHAAATHAEAAAASQAVTAQPAVSAATSGATAEL